MNMLTKIRNYLFKKCNFKTKKDKESPPSYKEMVKLYNYLYKHGYNPDVMRVRIKKKGEK